MKHEELYLPLMNYSKFIFVLLFLWAISGCQSKEQAVGRKFIGMWKLDKIESLCRETGNWRYDSSFSGWNGYILYDGYGHMGVQITPKGYKDFEVSKSLDSLTNEHLKELVRFYQSNWVYFADYEITGKTIKHMRLSATDPKDWGSVLTRDFEFRDDTLLLTAHEIVAGKKSRLHWIKK